MKCNAMKNFLADVYGNKKDTVDVAEESHKTETCYFSWNDYAKTEVCSGCEKGCKLSTQIVYRWPGFLVAQPIINGWVVASYLDEKKCFAICGNWFVTGQRINKRRSCQCT